MITKHQGKNHGRIKNLYLILKSAVTDIPLPSGLEISSDLTAGDFTKVQFLHGSGDWTETKSDSPQGSAYAFSAVVAINRDKKATTEALQGFDGKELIALMEDNNGEIRMLGDEEYHVRMNWTLTKSNNLYALTMTCEMDHPAYYYTGVFSII